MLEKTLSPINMFPVLVQASPRVPNIYVPCVSTEFADISKAFPKQSLVLSECF
jgi:hypothetical protein